MNKTPADFRYANLSQMGAILFASAWVSIITGFPDHEQNTNFWLKILAYYSIRYLGIQLHRQYRANQKINTSEFSSEKLGELKHEMYALPFICLFTIWLVNDTARFGLPPISTSSWLILGIELFSTFFRILENKNRQKRQAWFSLELRAIFRDLTITSDCHQELAYIRCENDIQAYRVTQILHALYPAEVLIDTSKTGQNLTGEQVVLSIYISPAARPFIENKREFERLCSEIRDFEEKATTLQNFLKNHFSLKGELRLSSSLNAAREVQLYFKIVDETKRQAFISWCTFDDVRKLLTIQEKNGEFEIRFKDEKSGLSQNQIYRALTKTRPDQKRTSQPEPAVCSSAPEVETGSTTTNDIQSNAELNQTALTMTADPFAGIPLTSIPFISQMLCTTRPPKRNKTAAAADAPPVAAAGTATALATWVNLTQDDHMDYNESDMRVVPVINAVNLFLAWSPAVLGRLDIPANQFWFNKLNEILNAPRQVGSTDQQGLKKIGNGYEIKLLGRSGDVRFIAREVAKRGNQTRGQDTLLYTDLEPTDHRGVKVKRA